VISDNHDTFVEALEVNHVLRLQQVGRVVLALDLELNNNFFNEKEKIEPAKKEKRQNKTHQVHNKDSSSRSVLWHINNGNNGLCHLLFLK
jgi:hypothetical protein